ncbi:MAG: 50S ribosomal protein L25 [Dehalococcoidales bacterium]|jgi:large subunit ribosomal protein L25|nr:50S ribosomal protein L25 [Dehalococcoidales bacterium]MDD3994304.1 50S ribosomal protein L25 [Dehalococcoidales bacterium]NLT27663.1 50S ribosomal protein L25 [Dehalococcoidales bacterium]
MGNIKLKASKRTVFGKSTKSLRRQGITPIHIFGNGIESLALQCDNSELKKLIFKEGATRLIDLEIEKEKKPRSVFIREIQRDAITGQLIHVDFYQVNKTEKMSADIPIYLTGESPAGKSKINMLEQVMNNIQIEALPEEMPPHIEVDISNLEDAGDAIFVKDLILGDDVATTADLEQIVVKITRIKAIVEEGIAAPATEEAEAAEETEAEQEE